LKFRNKLPNGTLTFKYIKDQHKEVSIPRPRVEVRLMNKDKSFKLAMLVDSGADVALIPLEVAEILELDLNSNDAIESSSASGKFQTIGRKVNAELIKGTRNIDLGLMYVRIPLQKSHENQSNGHALLGRSNFFKKFDVTFRENMFKLILKKPKKEKPYTTYS
jgi:hypothetical protein